MDRVHRRFLVVSTFAAIPIVLLMASLSPGTAPVQDTPPAERIATVQRAIAADPVDQADQVPAIRQVAGRQPEHRQTRPGLLQVIAGNREAGSRDHQHQNMRNDKSRGLFDSLFGTDSKANPNHHQQHSQHPSKANKQTTHAKSRSTNQRPIAKSKPDVNWDGIPYHQPERTRSKQAHQPIRDPVGRSIASHPKPAKPLTDQTGTRIIRGGSQSVAEAKPTNLRPVPTRTVANRMTAAPTVARKDSLPEDLPQPPADTSSIPAGRDKISSTSSSRRSGRRSLDALEAQVARKSNPAANDDHESMPEEQVALVPRVANTADPNATDPNAVEPTEPSELRQPEAGPASLADASSEDDQAQPESPSDREPSGTALAAIGIPSAVQPQELSDGSDPSHQPALASEPGGNYTVPSDRADQAVPTAGIPSHPFAGSTANGSIPAATASHRAGPPTEAFQSAPIGSGLAPNGDAVPLTPTAQPAYQTALLPGSSGDSFGRPHLSPSNRMTTTGQPVAGNPSVNNSIRADSHINGSSNHGHAVPMRTIDSAVPTAVTSSSPPSTSDDFDRSTYETRNQMRGGTTHVTSDAMATASELPGIRVVTHGPREIMIRQTSQYEIRVENRGTIDAEGVLVRAMVPDWAELGGQNASLGDVDVRQQGSGRQLVWTISHLPAGKSERMFVRLTAARSGSYGLDVDWTLLPQKSVAKVKVHEPRLDLTIEGPDEVIFGQSQTYKVRVLNPGDGTAPNVVFILSPNSATPQTQRIGDIPPGKEAQFDVELTAQDLGDLKIHGLATGELELRAEAAKTIRVAAANLEATLTGPELKYQNTAASYNLQVQNTGSVASNKVMAALRLPSGVQYLGGIEEASLQGDMLRWEITSLPPGATRNFQFKCNMESTGEHQFAFECKGTAAGETSVAIATRVESIADLVLTVHDPPAPAPIGTEVAYEIVIRNRGSKEATDVRAIAQFSHGIEPTRVEGQSGEVVTGQVLFDPISRIGAGGEIRLRVIAQADRGGHHRFRSEVRSGDTVLVAEEATHYMSPRSERVSRHSSDNPAR